MLLTIFQGSNPTAASTTPTRIDSRISRNATVSGEPPRKRYRPSLAAGNSLVSLGINGLPRANPPCNINSIGQMGNPPVGVNGRQRPRIELLPRLSASAPAFPVDRPRAAACPSAAG